MIGGSFSRQTPEDLEQQFKADAIAQTVYSRYLPVHASDGGATPSPTSGRLESCWGNHQTRQEEIGRLFQLRISPWLEAMNHPELSALAEFPELFPLQ
jgi:hypothetical protein